MHECDTISIMQNTSFTWQLCVQSAPESPRFFIIAIQTDRGHDQTKNPASFDDCKVRNMHVVLNSNRYPAGD